MPLNAPSIGTKNAKRIENDTEVRAIACLSGMMLYIDNDNIIS